MIHPPRSASSPVAQLPQALDILATQMHEAVAERRGARPGTEQYERAGATIAQLNELYGRLQRHMEIPTEIWLLDGGHAAPHGRG